jgi:PAS domain S-box-containing protein
MESEAIGRPVSEIFQIVHEHTRVPVESPADKVRRLNVSVTLENHTVLIRKDGSEIPIDDSGAPIRDRDGSLSGVVWCFAASRSGVVQPTQSGKTKNV